MPISVEDHPALSANTACSKRVNVPDLFFSHCRCRALGREQAENAPDIVVFMGGGREAEEARLRGGFGGFAAMTARRSGRVL